MVPVPNRHPIGPRVRTEAQRGRAIDTDHIAITLQQACASADTRRRPLFAEITTKLHALQTAEA